MREYLMENFTSLASNTMVSKNAPFISTISFERVPIQDGRTTDISVRVFAPIPPRGGVARQDFQVTVETTRRGWIFHTGAGHFAQRTITFSIFDAGPGKISFTIDIYADYAGRFIGPFIFAAVGREFERHTWNRLIEHIKEECRK